MKYQTTYWLASMAWSWPPDGDRNHYRYDNGDPWLDNSQLADVTKPRSVFAAKSYNGSGVDRNHSRIGMGFNVEQL